MYSLFVLRSAPADSTSSIKHFPQRDHVTMKSKRTLTVKRMHDYICITFLAVRLVAFFPANQINLSFRKDVVAVQHEKILSKSFVRSTYVKKNEAFTFVYSYRNHFQGYMSRFLIEYIIECFNWVDSNFTQF